MRDLTQAQYDAKLKAHGITRPLYGVMGYRDIGRGVEVSEWNAGPSRRSKLAYLLREQERIKKEEEKGK